MPTKRYPRELAQVPLACQQLQVPVRHHLQAVYKHLTLTPTSATSDPYTSLLGAAGTGAFNFRLALQGTVHRCNHGTKEEFPPRAPQTDEWGAASATTGQARRPQCEDQTHPRRPNPAAPW